MKKIVCILAAVAAAAGLWACGPNSQPENGGTVTESQKDTELDLEKVHQAVKDVYGENYVPSMAYDAQALQSLFGIPEDAYEEFIAEGPMMSVNVDVFMAIKAKEGKAEDVEKSLEAYRKIQIEDAVQYPMNQSKVQASQVVRHGNYVFFVMLGTATDEALEKDEEAALKSAQEENQKAVDAIGEFFK